LKGFEGENIESIMLDLKKKKLKRVGAGAKRKSFVFQKTILGKETFSLKYS